MENHVLMQEEIDKLLAAQQAESTPSGKAGKADSSATVIPASYRKYDFRRPTSNPKVHVANLSLLLENFPSVASASLSALLRMPVQVTRDAIDATTYEDYLHQMPEHVVHHMLTLTPLPGYSVLTIENQIFLAMIERLQGGQPNMAATPRKLTDVETPLSNTLALRLLSSAEQSWQSALTLQAKLQELVWDADYLQLGYPGDLMIVASFSVMLGKTGGSLHFVVPRSTLEPLTQQLGQREKRIPDKDRLMVQQEIVMSLLRPAQVSMDVRLGSTVLTANQLSKLNIGDVIVLDARIAEDLSVFVEGKRKFFAQPGTLGGNLGIRITRKVDEANEE